MGKWSEHPPQISPGGGGVASPPHTHWPFSIFLLNACQGEDPLLELSPCTNKIQTKNLVARGKQGWKAQAHQGQPPWLRHRGSAEMCHGAQAVAHPCQCVDRQPSCGHLQNKKMFPIHIFKKKCRGVSCSIN